MTEERSNMSAGRSGGSHQKPLMRSLGEFFGHIARAIKTDPVKPAAPQRDRRVVSERVEEREVPNPDGTGKMILRRTVVEEVEIERRNAACDAERQDSPQSRGGRRGGEGQSGGASS